MVYQHGKGGPGEPSLNLIWHFQWLHKMSCILGIWEIVMLVDGKLQSEALFTVTGNSTPVAVLQGKW